MSEDDQVEYAGLKRKRSAKLSVVTKAHNSVRQFNPEVDSAHILKTARENITTANQQFLDIVEKMLEHPEANEAEVTEALEAFQVAHATCAAAIEDTLATVREQHKSDDLPDLRDELFALKTSFEEFQLFADDALPAPQPTEIVVRTKDLEALKNQHGELWRKVYLKEKPRERTIMEQERNVFNTGYYKTLAWFYSKRTNTPAPASVGREVAYSPTVKLPRIELPTFDGAPDTWVTFRDTFKSLVHDIPSISGALKFRYLKTSIVDKNSPIKHLTETDAGYSDAWKAVMEFYDDKRRILNCHLNAMLRVKPMDAENHDELQRVLNEYSLHISSLEHMHTEVELYRAILAHLVIHRLDPHTRDLWETDNKGQTPFWPNLQKFLKERRKTLSTMPTPKPQQTKSLLKPAQKPVGKLSSVHATLNSPVATETFSASTETSPASDRPRAQRLKCHLCGNDHRLIACPQFINMPISQRLAKVNEWKICSSCFGPHALNSCTSKYRCRSCKQRHNTLLHVEQPVATSSIATHSLQAAPSTLHASAPSFSFLSSCNTASKSRNNVTLLQTAIVQIQDAQGDWHSARAFLDSGSDSNFISTSIAKALNLPLERTHVEANGLGGNRAAIIKQKLVACIGNSSEIFTMEFLVAPKITNPTPMVPVSNQQILIPPNLPLADPTFYVPGKIDILIGNHHYGELMRDGRIKLESGPILLNTAFGWIFTGSFPSDQETRNVHSITTQCHASTLSDLRTSVEKFYNLEDYRTPKRFLTEEERNCEQNFEQTYQRSPTGRFIVQILYKPNLSQLKNNYRNAMCQFLASEKRWQKNESLKIRVIAFMREYENLGHMSLADASKESPDSPAFYLPYHAVENPCSTTTKLRVVFNGSARTPSGLSLNDTQCVGPQVQCDVFELSLQFRIPPIVIKADVEKMYRQIIVAPHQRRFQRIIFREDPSEKLRIYDLNTVTYGTAAASYEATRCLQELGFLHREIFPEAAENIISRFYVDDFISGAETVDEAKKLMDDVVKILSSAEMKLRKFSSNNAEFLELIPEDLRDTVNEDSTIKTLGAKWNPKDDTIGFVTRPVRFESVTRRIILSEIASNFDADGLLGPITFNFKKFLKSVFRLSQPWDAPVPPKEAETWKEVASTFEDIGRIQIPRQVVIKNPIDIQLHGFCDASDAGYGACTYIVSENSRGEKLSRLLCAKSRISPKEYRSTARLELCGAVVLANLMEQVSNSIRLNFSKKVCWSDSAIVLYWLKKCPSQLQTFVANRVSEIQELSKEISWKHVRETTNPADLLSRGQTPAEILDCKLWWNGPDFLILPERKWPESIVTVDPNEPDIVQEFKRGETSSLAATTLNVLATDILENPFSQMIENSSRIFPVKWKLALVIRFVFNLRAKKLNLPRRVGPVQVQDLFEAEIAMSRICQVEKFSNEMENCLKGRPVPRNSKIKNLDPIWDPKLKLMRVGGRLNRAEKCDEDQKHPIILPKCHFARLLVREIHQQNLHAGINATHSFIRLRYWPVQTKNLVRTEVKKCVKCFRARPKMIDQMMGQLPPKRVTPSPPFENTGVDFCGPFDMKVSKIRSAKTIKSYVSVFVCLSTKAIHLEVVTDLTTEAFLAAFDKFVSRRGLPRSMFSDNGLNFVGASNKLAQLYEFLAKNTTQNEIREYLARQEVQWNFIPPRAASQGGLWEAAVKSMKHHFYRVASNALLTFEEFDRLKSKIEAILNSRPLTAISEDPSDLTALTAGHFLIGRPLIAKLDADLTDISITKLQRWDRVVQMQQHFWNRWSREYLHQLQVRTKNFKEIVPVSIGQLVLLQIDNCPSMNWPLARIIDIFPGKDGITRVAKLRTAKSTYERPVSKLALLPIDLEEANSVAPGRCSS